MVFLQGLGDNQGILFILVMVCVASLVFILAAPLLTRDKLQQRMKAVSVERARIRERERGRMEKNHKPISLRSEPRAYMKRVVDEFNLRDKLMGADTRDKLIGAGYRADSHVITYLFARVVMPVVLGFASAFYIFTTGLLSGYPVLVSVGAVLVIAYIGHYAPNIWISNATSKRQLSIRRAWPDALDLLRICVESGASIEAAFRKVSEEIGIQSIALAEEMALTTAELSYLSERRKAYENLGKRTDVEGVKAVCAALIQAERYGTPVSVSLRVLAQETRDMRMNEAEKKAAALPPKLTVPMILFFMPSLFIVILGPAAIKMTQL